MGLCPRLDFNSGLQTPALSFFLQNRMRACAGRRSVYLPLVSFFLFFFLSSTILWLFSFYFLILISELYLNMFFLLEDSSNTD